MWIQWVSLIVNLYLFFFVKFDKKYFVDPHKFISYINSHNHCNLLADSFVHSIIPCDPLCNCRTPFDIPNWYGSSGILSHNYSHICLIHCFSKKNTLDITQFTVYDFTTHSLLLKLLFLLNLIVIIL